jgi:hypothetical protein
MAAQLSNPRYSPSADAGAAAVVVVRPVSAEGGPTRLIHTVYRQYGCRLAEIADQLGVHAATVNRRLKQAEQANV